MTNPIVVKEYSNIKLEDCDLVKLHHYLECKNLGSALKVTPDGIKTKSWVGVIKYKKIHLQILPKLIYTEEYDNQSEEEKESIKANILQNLIYMLSFVKKLEIKTSDAAKLSTTKNPFIEVLIREFAKSLFDCLKRITPKKYIREEENLNYVKGKIKFVENLRYNCINKARFYCEYDEFSDNNILNQLFLFVSTCLYNISTDNYNKKLLKLIINYYSDITLVRFDKFKANKIKLSRNQELFKKPLKLAKMFVENTSVDLSKNKIENITLIWDMNKLFEEFVFKILKQKENDLNLKFTAQKCKRLFKDNKCRNTYVDIFAEPNKISNTKPASPDKASKIIIDTKYKKLASIDDFSNADVYQVSTYCFIHNAESAILIYPRWNTEEPEISDACLNSDIKNINIKFKTINLKYENLFEHQKEIIKEICDIFKTEKEIKI